MRIAVVFTVSCVLSRLFVAIVVLTRSEDHSGDEIPQIQVLVLFHVHVPHRPDRGRFVAGFFVVRYSVAVRVRVQAVGNSVVVVVVVVYVRNSVAVRVFRQLLVVYSVSVVVVV